MEPVVAPVTRRFSESSCKPSPDISPTLRELRELMRQVPRTQPVTFVSGVRSANPNSPQRRARGRRNFRCVCSLCALETSRASACSPSTTAAHLSTLGSGSPRRTRLRTSRGERGEPVPSRPCGDAGVNRAARTRGIRLRRSLRRRRESSTLREGDRGRRDRWRRSRTTSTQ
jgi:hypothetical protein